jgi:hypothetical protein
MKPYRGTLLATVVLLAALPLFGCGEAKNGGSGSYIRVQSITPSNFEPDTFVTVCKVDLTTGELTLEPNHVTNQYAQVTLANQSAPTTPTGETTSSYVTMSHYRVHFTGVSKSVSLPDINEGGWSASIPADGTAVMTIVVMDLNTLFILRDRYAPEGSGEAVTVRATITMWGKDSFDNTVSTEAQVILVVADYVDC